MAAHHQERRPDTDRPPDALPVRPEGIPASLKALDQWVAWKWQATGKPEKPWTKVPVDPKTGRKASSTDPATWATFEVALAYAERYGLPGVGFVFAPGGGIMGVDLDGMRDPETGHLAEEAQRILDDLASYAESSPTRTGVHVLASAVLPPGRRKLGSYEMYDRGRFFTVTGHRLPGSPADLRPAQAAIDALHARVFGAAESSSSEASYTGSDRSPSLLDHEVLTKALDAKNGAKVRALLDGDRSGYTSRSEADLALVSELGFWTQDPAQLDRLFRGSRLMRRKWDQRHFGDGRTYGQATIARALDRSDVWAGSPRIVVGPGRDGPVRVEDADGEALTRVAVPAFPVWVLPPLPRKLVVDGAAAIGCPPDFIAVPLLAFVGALAGKHRSLRIKEGFVVRPIFWTGVIGAPGTAKSPALDVARSPLDALQRLAWDAYQEALTTWEEDVPKERGPRPRLSHFFATDTTTEAVASALVTSPGIAIVHDELAGWVAAFDAYRKAGDRQTWLSSWSGSPLKPNRKGGDPIYIPDPVVCVTGGIQPDVLPTLAGEAARNDGFLPRFLLAWPDATPAPWTEDAIATTTVEALTESLKALRGTGDAEIRLADEAYQEWKAWHGENLAVVERSHGLAQGWAAKAPLHLARIALALHVLAHPKATTRTLSPDTMHAAIAVTEYFRAHLGRVLPAFGAATTILNAGLGARVLRVLTAAYPEGIGKAEIAVKLGGHEPADAIQRALEDLESRGLAKQRPVPTEGRPRTEWRWAGPQAEPAGHRSGDLSRNHVTTEHTTNGRTPGCVDESFESGEESPQRDKWKDVISPPLPRNHEFADGDPDDEPDDDLAGYEHWEEPL